MTAAKPSMLSDLLGAGQRQLALADGQGATSWALARGSGQFGNVGGHDRHGGAPVREKAGSWEMPRRNHKAKST
jgi:hypothetical protein